MKKILMIGGGISGQAAAQLATALDIECCIVNDTECAGAKLSEIFSGVDLVVVSPGVTGNSRLLQYAVAEKFEVISELEFGIRHFPGKLLAVTGTNGKTTTVELTEFLLKKLQVNAVAAGNIGLGLAAVAAGIIRGEFTDAEKMVAVLEVSSFQLEHTQKIPALAAVLLNVESDHINRYAGGLSEYRAVKERIFNAVPEDKRFYGMSMTGQKYSCGFEILNDTLYFQGKTLLDLHKTALAAEHNQENLLAALSLVASVVPLATRLNELTNALQEFKTGDHRISPVAEINGVKYIDDSKATNPAAVIAAVKSLEKMPCKNIVLIAGGLDKDMDFTPLATLTGYLKKVIVYGRCGSKVAGVFTDEVPVFDAKTDFALAVREAAATAIAGDTVLLSPAAASMDMFKDYKERGNVFAQLVRALPQ
ncbi:MAG: UDP-N-acetylmuramoyl-L-alanine--D-glutamate ligase [Lentisphaerae bacterium]|nr:UDP-N-acetylmuramoyl-L-alanine--D-glutamate ligase [Lentisphaerota bacterium]